MFSLSDLTPRQGAMLDRLRGDWRVIGRRDSSIVTAIDLEPQPYRQPPTLVLLRDPDGNRMQLDREGNLTECF